MAILSRETVKLHDESVPWWTSCRLTTCIVAFFACMCVYALRFNMSVTIVCMTFNNNDSSTNGDNETVHRPILQPYIYQGGLYIVPASGKGEFDWSRSDVGWVLSAFFIGYIFTQLPGGVMATKMGAKVVIGGCLFLLSTLTLVTPLAARGSVYLLMAVQALKGLASGVYYPAFYQLWGRWAPPQERAFLCAIAVSGNVIGSVLSSVLSGYLCDHGFAGGWPSVFYVFGIFSLVCSLAWYVLVYSSPSEHPRISTAELNYIQASLPPETGTKKPSVPWRAMMKTPAVYGIFTANVCNSWASIIALVYLPQYMNDVLKVDIQSNGLFSALPGIVGSITAILGGLLADFLIRKQLMNMTWTRKLLQSIGTLPSVAIAIWVGFVTGQDRTLAVILLTFWSGLSGFTASGSYLNMVDIAPRFSGIIMGIDNTLEAIPGIIVPPITSAMTKHGTVEEWQRVFFLCAGIIFSGSWLAYIILGDATEQEWAQPQDEGEVVAEENPSFIKTSMDHDNDGYTHDMKDVDSLEDFGASI